MVATIAATSRALSAAGWRLIIPAIPGIGEGI